MGRTKYLSASILVVDDEESNVVLLDRMLRRAGYGRVTTTTDSREVTNLLAETAPDLIVLDLMMPFLDGYAVMAEVQNHLTVADYLPILVLTADTTPQALQKALSEGAKDFLTKPFDQTELLLRVGNLLETRFLYKALQQQLLTLEDLNQQAQEAILFRDESMSTISHDFGQPLTALRLTTEVLLEEIGELDAPEKSRLAEYLQNIDTASAQMASMIGEMSDLARLQMGRELVLQRRPMDLVAAARRQVALVQKTSKKHRLRFEAKQKEITGAWDEMRLGRVLSNLLSNAVKFSPRGGQVTVAVDAGENEARVSVSDQGMGIPSADIPHVFDAFFRARNVAGHINGTGIGLAGAKQVVEQHGGNIMIESEEGYGTTVRIRLPIS